MLNIAICDDSEEDALTAKKIVKDTLAGLHTANETVCYSSAEDIEYKLIKKKEFLDILILDIDMPEVSGLELAEELRRNNVNIIIIFLSNHEEFVFRAIEFQPFRYIRKIKINSEMPIAIQSALKLINSQEDKQVILDTPDGNIRVMMSEIVYFEADKRKTAVHLSNGSNLTVNVKISEFNEILGNKFIMIHRSCGVNSSHVKTMLNDVLTLKNGKKLLVSRRRSKEVRQAIIREWGEKF